MLHASPLAEVGPLTYPWLVTWITCLQMISASNKNGRLATLTAVEQEFLIRVAVEVSGRDRKQEEQRG